VKILVVGLGSMGRRRVRNLLYVGGHEIAGCEPNEERRSEVATELGIAVFPAFEAGMEWGPDAIVISTPPDRHSEYAAAAVRAGLHFFTEASVVRDGMEELIELVRNRTIIAAPSCTMRFHPAVNLIKQRLEERTIGRPLAFTHHVGQYLPDWHPWEDYRTFYGARRATGAAREIVPFELNWLTHLFGRIVALGCFSGKLSNLDTDIDDLYATLLEFESRVCGSMVIDVISRPALRQARIIGEEGTLVWNWQERKVSEWRASDPEWREFPDPPPIEGPGGTWVAENMYIDEMRAFLAAIEEGPHRYPFSPEQDFELLGVLLELEAASSSRRGITQSSREASE
jgi:predicted dehydrogenase